MNCPNCDGRTKVIDSRKTYRRRECLVCGTRFSTEETLIGLLDIPVAWDDGRWREIT